jgi:hypothetical protein
MVLASVVTHAISTDSLEVLGVAETVFDAMLEGKGNVIAEHLSVSAMGDMEEILVNLREYPDLTLAMLNFNWGVEVIDMDVSEWNAGDLLSAIFSSPLSREVLYDPMPGETFLEISGDSANVIWMIRGEEWPMMLVRENGAWKVNEIEYF